MSPVNYLLPMRSKQWNQLPVWFKVFSVYFIISAVVNTGILLAQVFGVKVSMSIYGISSDNVSVSTVIYIIYLVKALVAIGLYRGKRWAIKLGLLDAFGGIAIWILMVLQPLLGNFSYIPDQISAEIFFIIAYLYILFRENKWHINQSCSGA